MEPAAEPSEIRRHLARAGARLIFQSHLRPSKEWGWSGMSLDVSRRLSGELEGSRRQRPTTPSEQRRANGGADVGPGDTVP